MKFTERSFYSSEGLRPRPYIYFNSDQNLLIVLTNWSKNLNKESIVKYIENYLLSSSMDTEVTSPFISIPNLGRTANSLRTSLLLLNDMIYKEHNKNEFLTGLEIFVGFQRESEFIFAHIGQPNILISRSGKNILPLHQNLDLSLDLSFTKPLPPVPSKLLGLEAHIEIEVESFKLQPEDQLILLSYSWIPKELLNLKDSQRSFDKISSTLADIDDQSFWLGVVQF